ncbi:MAG: hypothetical protein JOZ31_13170 [Verrucomicrobia bacterium]|nr:hypothetical protein [Verrucomicrobiota bacterium]MBV8482580.1 hypothetical protein [Verrucomicrobiota bacterium]
MFVLIGAVALISACTGYNQSTSQDHRSQGAYYGGESMYERTGQPSMISGWRPQYDGGN